MKIIYRVYVHNVQKPWQRQTVLHADYTKWDYIFTEIELTLNIKINSIDFYLNLVEVQIVLVFISKSKSVQITANLCERKPVFSYAVLPFVHIILRSPIKFVLQLCF